MTNLIKDFSSKTKTIDAAAGIYEVLISTEAVDRQGDIVRAAGGQFENYLKNPVVLFAHDYSDFPIAKTLTLQKKPGIGVIARFQFPKWGTYPKADIARKLWDEGLLNAASIGFNPIKSINLDPNKPWGPQEYTEWELLEFSLVPVPANQEAVRMALRDGRVKSSKNPALETLNLIGEISKVAQRQNPTEREALKLLECALDNISALCSKRK